MSKTNPILAVLIIIVLCAFGFFGWRAWHQESPGGQGKTQRTQTFVPAPQVVNRGEASRERDAILEADVRAISDAARSYAKDHKGSYPESDFKNPCTGTVICLKSVNINTSKKVYLNPIPQVKPYNMDYYYKADNAAKTYCVKTPVLLETANTMVFACTQAECKQAPALQSCTK